MAKIKKPLGVVVYDGPSVLDGQPIIVVATLESSNAKTGNMVQTWILAKNINPVEAIKTGFDLSTCGSCVHRRYLGGACYVNVAHAPLAIFKTFQAGKYPIDSKDMDQFFKGRSIRFGSYGDPAAVPVSVWKRLKALSHATTGYTHQSGHKNFNPEILKYCMLSADTPRQAIAAHKKGIRTFRVKTAESDFLPNEIECLSDSKGLSCIQCKKCNGATKGKNIAINVHGNLKNKYINKYRAANIIAIG